MDFPSKDTVSITITERLIDLLDPQVEDIFAYDIAVGLSRAPRFAGHTKQLYSVAEHCDWCRQECEILYPGDTALAFKVMMHDAHEYILCDIPQPLKNLLPGYEAIACRLQDAIHTRFGISIQPSDAVIIKQIDAKALSWEWDNKVMRKTGIQFNDAANIAIFLDHFKRLCHHPYVLK